MLFGVAGMMALIACSNVAALLLVRGVSRQREMAIRKAVGANRFPIARQLLAEGFVLVACGAGAGLILDAFLRDRLTYVRWPSALRFALRVPFPKRQWTISIRVINGICGATFVVSASSSARLGRGP
ncbi:MAG: hypothetical protein DMG58_19255 [Acidobacteria bacterium]|nr:MAG: hypothetical protein DMG58_19255 [Acidobacteriota bacterium]